LFVAVLSTLLALALSPAPSYAPIVSEARAGCNWHEDALESGLLWALAYVEIESGVVPPYARGITLAAACRESRGFRLKCGDGGLSCGVFQLRRWAELHYGVDRFDPLQSARVWLHRIGVVTKKARRRCKGRRAFLVANAWVGSGPKGYTCRYSRHWQLLKRWKRRAKWR
jgi:hypothetical protein